jgi:hypothetical protein
MRKFLTLMMLLNLAITSFGQMKRQIPNLTSDEYMEKSRKQNSAGWIALGGGAALITVAKVFPEGEIVSNGYWGPTHKNDGIRMASALVGIVSVLYSPALFIESGKNKRRAMGVSFKMDNVPQLQKSSMVYENVPSLNLKIGL